MTRAHIYYSGMVQGVGFRYTTQRYAKALGLLGWVKNLNDGRVEIEAQGPKANINQLIDNLKDHFGGYIKEVDVSFQPALVPFISFEILT